MNKQNDLVTISEEALEDVSGGGLFDLIGIGDITVLGSNTKQDNSSGLLGKGLLGGILFPGIL